jgi:hypothetical protein
MESHRRHRLAWLLPLALGLTLSACVPAAVADRLAGPAAQEVERTAYVAYHRMELGRLQLGAYTTNVLVDVELPRGARLTLEDFADDGYRLRVDSDAVPGVAWYVTPSGVRRVIQR